MEITWFGHSNFRLATGETTLLIDPFFEGNPSAPVTYEDIEACDIILVTHDHGDHIGQTLELAQKHNAKVVAIFDLIQALMPKGLSDDLAVGMNIGGTVFLDGIAIKMVQAMHSSITGVPVGYILTFPDDTCVYYSGDTGLFGDMGLFAEFHDIDIAMLPIGGHFTMDARQAAYACKLLKCDTVIPMHWGTWPLLDSSTKEFAERLAMMAPDTRLAELKVGVPTEI
ncbi:metal-dependent hydrolase [Pseudodesulfovibrio cashew]|uniref:UPF0173 metal-dependent hydrolase GM415_10930 n=1 Tax=Pseudodesulfovibrio cashew TaxID=2678688 RepID=A0A6I6JCS6_9BACT|nr:metal-dependent hydrolase [Pseudodesulfovibrio cashew]QGY40615.1 metal-dependent hydrolase [Pseudodesulfovibrio cashew]